MTVIAQPPAAGPDPTAGFAPAVDLIRAAAAGDRRAERRLVALVRPVVLRYCRARLGATPEAFDAAREICGAVAAALPTISGVDVSFPAVVHRIARLRVDRVDVPAVRGAAGSMPVLLRDLAPLQRDVLVLRVAVGLSVEQTAEAVESTTDGVRLAQHHALERLRSGS